MTAPPENIKRRGGVSAIVRDMQHLWVGAYQLLEELDLSLCLGGGQLGDVVGTRVGDAIPAHTRLVVHHAPYFQPEEVHVVINRRNHHLQISRRHWGPKM